MNALVEAMRAWAEALPPEAAQVSYPAIPADDDYGLETIISFQPNRPDACPLEVGITFPSAQEQAAAYVSIDSWGAAARRTGLRVAPGKEDWIALFFEPIVISAERLCEICAAVARGAIRMEVGAWGEKLGWTAGSVQLRDGPLHMRGPASRPPLVGLLSSVGLCRRINVEYVPWC
jgi:hypothetical protein